MTPLVFIGKKIQRRALEGEEVSVLKQRRTARIPSVPEDPHSALAAAKAIASPSRLRKKSSVEGVVCLPSVVQCIFIELAQSAATSIRIIRKLHTRCATCGESSVHDEPWQAEVWADIHEFEHSRHRVRLFEQTRAEGLKEIGDWRDKCA